MFLSHAIGTLPVLSERLAQLETGSLYLKTLAPNSPKTPEAILEDAKSFYFDLAFGGMPNILDVLNVLLNWAPREHILFGSDYPYANVEAYYSMPEKYREAYYTGNSLELFPRSESP